MVRLFRSKNWLTSVVLKTVKVSRGRIAFGGGGSTFQANPTDQSACLDSLLNLTFVCLALMKFRSLEVWRSAIAGQSASLRAVLQSSVFQRQDVMDCLTFPALASPCRPSLQSIRPRYSW